MNCFDYDVVSTNGEHVCINCAKKQGIDTENDPEVSPVFYSEELDSHPHCSYCQTEFTDYSLTKTGQNWENLRFAKKFLEQKFTGIPLVLDQFFNASIGCSPASVSFCPNLSEETDSEWPYLLTEFAKWVQDQQKEELMDILKALKIDD